jgi:DNA-binding transcriptional LysR family regulator
MLDLRQLQVLLAVAETGSYTAAAEQLGYTQPAVSYQMRRLQQQAGTQLAVRAGRGVQLTQAGRDLVRSGQQIFASVRAAEQGLATVAARGNAEVRVAVFKSCCATLVPAALARLGGSDPAIRLVLHQAEPDEARGLLRSGEADLGLLCTWDDEPLPDGEDAMLRVPLFEDRRCAVLPRDHPLAARATIDLAELAEERWVMESARERFTAGCLARGFAPRIAATVDDQVTILNLVAAGLGVTLMTELELTAYADLRLVARPLAPWPLRSTFALLWPDMARVPAVAALLGAVRACARDLPVGPHRTGDRTGAGVSGS